MKNKIEGVVFDLYNTLIYVSNDSHSYERLLADRFPDKGERREALDICLKRNFDSFEDLASYFGVQNKDLSKYENDLKEAVDSVKLYPETKKVLKILKDVEYPLGLLSNASTSYKKPFYDKKLQPFFDSHIFSCDVGHRKPEQNIYDIMAFELDIPKENLLMVGDSVSSDYNGARNAGLNAVLLDRDNNKDAEYKIDNLEGVFDLLTS